MKINPIIPVWLMAVFAVIIIALKRKGIAAYIRQIVIALLLFIINLRIMIPDGTVIIKNQLMEARVIFVIDNTISMVARDYDGGKERAEGVRKDCEKIVKELNGAKFEVISFDNEAKLICPYTTNGNYVNSVIANMYPVQSLYAKGTSLNTVKKMLVDTTKSARDKKDGKVFVFFISDGENTNKSTLESFEEVADNIDGGAVMGYGTSQGGEMFVRDYYSGVEEQIMDRTGMTTVPAVSRIDENNLKKIASDMAVDYYNMNDEGDIDSYIAGIKKSAQTTSEDVQEKGYQDIYYFFAIPLAALLIWEIIHYKRKV